MTEAHEHQWRMGVHLDGCHFYSTSYACECGATRTLYSERDVQDDPYSAVWMERDEDNPCTRCDELLAGATPKREDTTQEVAI